MSSRTRTGVGAASSPRRALCGSSRSTAIRALVDAGAIVIAVGGGGIPVVSDDSGDLHGVEAVIDKDLGCSLLAQILHADLFLITTAIEKVALNFGTTGETFVDHLSLAEAKRYLAEGIHFAKGSMEPKVEAIVEYLERTGGRAIVTDPANVEAALAGKTGTHFSVE